MDDRKTPSNHFVIKHKDRDEEVSFDEFRDKVSKGEIEPFTFIRSELHSNFRWRKAVDVPIYVKMLEEFGFEIKQGIPEGESVNFIANYNPSRAARRFVLSSVLSFGFCGGLMWLLPNHRWIGGILFILVFIVQCFNLTFLITNVRKYDEHINSGGPS